MISVRRMKRMPFFAAWLVLLLVATAVQISMAQLLRQVIQAALPVALKDANGLARGVNGLVIDSASRIWLTLRGRHSLGMVNAGVCATESNCAVTEFFLPNAEAIPKFATLDAQGDVWITATWQGGSGLLYKFDPDTETFVEYLAPGEDPFDIAVDSRGVAWFTDFIGGTINSINTRTGLTLVEYRAPVGQHCRGIAVDANDVVWSACGATLVRYRRTPLAILEEVFALPKGVKPFGVIADAGLMWIVDQQATRLYRFNDATDTFTSWVIPSLPQEDPLGGGGTTVDPHWLVKKGDLIYYTGFTGVLGSFNVKTQSFGSYLSSPSRTKGSGAYDIATDRVGRVWFTEVTANKLSRFYEFSPTLPKPPGLGPQPPTLK
jgi:streptogramin lyase